MITANCRENIGVSKQEQVSSWNIKPKSALARSIEFGKEDWKTEKRYVFSITSKLLTQYDKAKDRITNLCQGDEYSEPLNSFVQKNALKTLNILWLNRILPSFINSTGDDSLLFEFFNGKNSFLIEFYNTGEIVYLKKIENAVPYVREINSNQIKEIVSEIAHAYANVSM